MSTEKRREPRISLNIPGAITWHKPDGSPIYERVLVIDLSDRGALIEAATRLLSREFIRIEIPQEKVDGMASVRRCEVKGMKFLVGVEFINAREARPKVARWA